MIRINLIPTKRKKKSKPMATYLVGAVFVLIGFVAITFFVHSFMSSTVGKLEEDSAKNVKTLKDLDRIIKEVQNFEKLRDKFEARKKVIEDLTANQSLPVRMLDELSDRLSSEVWLISLNIKGESVSLAGVGFSHNDIVDFVQNMKQSKLFKDVVLLGTTSAAKGDVTTHTFNISFKLGTVADLTGGDNGA